MKTPILAEDHIAICQYESILRKRVIQIKNKKILVHTQHTPV